jgi:hypothetical protein
MFFPQTESRVKQCQYRKSSQENTAERLNNCCPNLGPCNLIQKLSPKLKVFSLVYRMPDKF